MRNMKRIRYNRASFSSTLSAAKTSVTGTALTRYVYATANGFTIWHCPPPLGQDYYRVTDAAIERVERQ